MAIQIQITPILPKGDYLVGDFARFEKMTTTYLRHDLNNRLIKDFNETTKNWQGKPSFKGEVTSTPAAIILYVRPTPSKNTDKWARVDEGVKRHIIRVKKAPKLTVQSYTPHTRPKGKWGGPGKRQGDVTYTPVVYQWPGIAPREFTKIIARKREREVVENIHRIVRKAFF